MSSNPGAILQLMLDPQWPANAINQNFTNLVNGIINGLSFRAGISETDLLKTHCGHQLVFRKFKEFQVSGHLDG